MLSVSPESGPLSSVFREKETGRPEGSELKGLFIAGTDTGVGKTHIAAIILRQLRADGVRVAAFKPACSGAEFAAGQPSWDDLDRLRDALGGQVSDDDLCPQRFLAPLAPPVAARKEGRSVDLAAIDAGWQRACRNVDVIVVEGAGGWLCPLTDNLTFADWVADRRLPVLIVARPGLGTINHTLLTIDAVRRRDLAVAAVVLNPTGPDAIEASTADNAEEIECRAGVPVLQTHYADSTGELLHRQQPVRIRWRTLMGPVG
jgi:dethiobiotin synthetase